LPVGLVASLARPGGNLTGINFLTAELTAKRLLLLRDLMPSADRVGVLVNPGNVAATETMLRTCGAPLQRDEFCAGSFRQEAS
jgi:putative ABC transport system substrate-binding protein